MHVRACVFKRDFDISNVYKYGRNPIAFNGLVDHTCSHRPSRCSRRFDPFEREKTGRRREKTGRVFELLVRMKPFFFFFFVAVGEAEWRSADSKSVFSKWDLPCGRDWPTGFADNTLVYMTTAGTPLLRLPTEADPTVIHFTRDVYDARKLSN